MVPLAELVESGLAIEGATGELPGVAHRFGLACTVAERVVAIAVLDRACTYYFTSPTTFLYKNLED